MSNIKWCFPSSNGGEKQGLNNSGIETFKDTPVKSLAREICQNSLDAAHDKKTVVVEFNTFSIASDEFPDKKGFNDVLNKCLEYWESNPNQKSKNFFTRAIERLNAPKINFLRISDFNTTGLRGSNSKTSSDWDNLINSSGASEKGDSKGGSFGIGKNAPFACSDFRTVFYSTYDIDGLKANKGVSKLTSFKLGVNKDQSDNISQGTGYYGIDNGYNILHSPEMLNLDKSFTRKEYGTDIFISGFSNMSEDFKSSIIAEVLDGFLMAIWDNKLEIVVNSYRVNKSTLADVVATYKKSLSETTIQNYEILSNEKTEWINLPFEYPQGISLGNIKLAFAIRYDGSNKISMIRSSGMKIMDKTGLCPSLRFAGIGIICGDELNTFLRNLENPAHTKWLPERYEKNPTMAKGLLKQLFELITNKLTEEASKAFSGEIDIEGAGEYLPDEDNDIDEGKQKVHEKETLNKIIDIDFQIHKKVESVANLETDELGDDLESTEATEGSVVDGDDGQGFEHDGHKPSGQGDRDTEDVGLDDSDEMNGQKSIYVKSKQVRIICINKKERLYRLLFTPTVTTFKGFIEIFKIAEQNEKMAINVLGIKNDTELICRRNRVGYFRFEEDNQISVDLKLDVEEYSTMGVKLYAYKG